MVTKQLLLLLEVIPCAWLQIADWIRLVKFFQKQIFKLRVSIIIKTTKLCHKTQT